MNHQAGRLLFWSPRILSIAFAVFLGVFALDVFREPRSFWETGLAFSIHMIPSAIVVAILAVAWRWEWLGTLLFALVAVLYTWDVLPRHLSWAAIMGTPLLLIAALFLTSWIVQLRHRLRATH